MLRHAARVRRRVSRARGDNTLFAERIAARRAVGLPVTEWRSPPHVERIHHGDTESAKHHVRQAIENVRRGVTFDSHGWDG